jgi:hypothetical protein
MNLLQVTINKPNRFKVQTIKYLKSTIFSRYTMFNKQFVPLEGKENGKSGSLNAILKI